MNINDIIGDLNKEQKSSVIQIENPIRIIAGPGSGKTKVLTKKIAYLIKFANIKPNRILALTFTNKAANEMKNRVMDIIGNDYSNNMFITTFHSFCYRFLKEEIYLLNGFNKQFVVIDSVDQDNILKEVYKIFEITKKDLSFFSMKEYISFHKINNIIPLEKEDSNDEIEIIKNKIYGEYQKVIKQSNSLDYDDLLIYTKKILNDNYNIREKWRNKFDYYLIDEFQDTSKIQFEIINLIAKKDKITIVGDPDQTIYSWRGADISFINNFDKYYENVITITLIQNYRSTPNILKIANNLIKNNTNRLPKDLITNNKKGDNVEYYNAFNNEMEAMWIISNINKIRAKENNLNEIAILYRSNYYSRSIEDALIKNLIPYKIVSGQKFYEREEIKDSLAYLRCVFEPTNISLKRIINVPSRKLGDTTLKKIIEFADNKQVSIWEVLNSYIDFIDISNEKRNNLNKFIKIIKKYKKSIENKEPIYLILENLLNEIGYIEMLEKNQDNISLNRIENIKELINSILIWESKNEGYIEEYLNFISLETILDQLNENDLEHITLMTIHAAKGLEFDYVFVIGLNEGVFPSSKVIKQQDEGRDSFGMEEERRLAYVAFTRAKSKLFLSSSQNNNYSFDNSFKNNPSRFIYESNVTENSVLLNENLDNKLNLKNNLYEETKNFEPGDKIKHNVFGEGIVLDIKGDSIIIEFKEKKIGVKQLLKNHISLEKVY